MIDEKKLIEDVLNTSKDISSEWETAGILNLIHKQPKVGEWIPVSERLPELGSSVIVSTKNGSVYGDVMFNYENITKTKPNFFFDEWEDGFDFVGEYEVIAWMPLPALYKGVEE